MIRSSPPLVSATTVLGGPASTRVTFADVTTWMPCSSRICVMTSDHVRSLAVTFDLSVTSEADRRIVGDVGRRPPCHFSMQK